MNLTPARRWQLVQFDEIPPTACPCGDARRALADVAELPLTIHRTEISSDARLHYHRALTETYYILSCQNDARMELDGEVVAVQPGTCIMIPPLVRHRAIGRMSVLIVVYPKFDPADEWFD
jgi:mannose-6-phosphate isomerase-like protein (cupin superfamily)